jgi:hypothetical protein
MAPATNNYSHVVTAFMSFKDACIYMKDAAFSDEQLLAATPADLKHLGPKMWLLVTCQQRVTPLHRPACYKKHFLA